MKSLLLVMFVFVSSLALAQSRPGEQPSNAYAEKINALMAEHRYDDVHDVANEWRTKVPAEANMANGFEARSDAAKVDYMQQVLDDSRKQSEAEEARRKQMDAEDQAQ
jgi:hypothetical protein